jgi:hypothetical protein
MTFDFRAREQTAPLMPAVSTGETAARERFRGWAFDRNCLATYFETRNGQCSSGRNRGLGDRPFAMDGLMRC